MKVFINLENVPFVCELSGDIEDYNIDKIYVEDSEIDIKEILYSSFESEIIEKINNYLEND